LGLGVAAGLLLGRDEGTVRVVQAQVSIPGAAAVLTVQGHHGRLHTLRFPRPAPGRVYELWLQRERGSRLEPTSELFTVDRDGTASVDVPGDLRHVARIMVTAEPRGGSRVPSGPPVLTVTPA